MNDVVIEFLRSPRKPERIIYGPETTEIKLVGMNIHELVFVEIGPMENLHVLDISDNNLEHINLDILSNAAEISKINLEDNKLQSIKTDNLKDLDNLSLLNLSNNLVKNIDISALIGCRNLEHLNLANNHIHSIDLDPICSCSRLTSLRLEGNQLDAIDLSPLRLLTGLAYLDISHNWIREIDLSPLKNHELVELNLSENPLSNIDLTPLQGNTHIKNIQMNYNQIKSLDLRPLASCKQLHHLGISNSKIQEIDLVPLTNCLNLRTLDISGIVSLDVDLWPVFTFPNLEDFRFSAIPTFSTLAPPRSVEWPTGIDRYRKNIRRRKTADEINENGLQEFKSGINSIYSYMSPLGRFYLRVAVMEAIGLGHFKGYDCDVLKLLNAIQEETDFETMQISLKSKIYEGLIEQVQSGGSTLLVDVELAQDVPELAVITPRILELRRQELKNVVLGMRDGKYDLVSLWSTTYGFEILSALKLGIEIDTKGKHLERLKTELLKFDIELQTSEEPSSSFEQPKISEELRAYILVCANKAAMQQ